jgi:D-alanyl-D-alanine carboxypeptidase
MGVTGSSWFVRLGLHLGRAPRQLATILLPLLLLATPALARQQSAILIDYDSGEVLFAEDPDASAYPASLTKMMTLYLVFESLDQGRLTLDTKLKVSARAAAMPPTKLGLKAGSSIRVEDAIMALVTRSANDIASTIGENLGGSEARFAELMTTQARRLGMSRTTFRNASGLPHEDQRTTARDLSILAMSLIKNHPQHYRYFSRQRFVYGKRTLGNHNRMLASYTGMDGIKTGYTNASGFNLAASAVRKGRRLVAVVMGGNSAPARDVRMAKLLDRGFVQLAKERTTPQKVPAPLLVAGLPEVQEAAFVPGVTPPVPAARPEPAVEPAPASELGLPGEPVDEAVLAEAAEAMPVAASLDPALAAVAVAKSRPVTPVTVAAPVAQPKPKQPARARTAAARKAPAPAPRTAAGTAFGVQVGVFGSSIDARRATKLALQRAPRQLRGTFVSVNSVKQRSRVLYRAQLIGMDRSDAQTVCRQLQKYRQDCLVVQSTGLTMASS